MKETVLQTAKRIRQRDENPVWNRMAGIVDFWSIVEHEADDEIDD